MINEFEQPYTYIRDTYTGTGGYDKHSGYSYLIKHPRETDVFYNDRKKNAFLENLFQPLQDLFIDPIKSKKFEISTENKDLKKIVRQAKVVNAAKESLTDFKIYFQSIFSVMTELKEDGTVDTELLPEIEQIFPEDLTQLNMFGLAVNDAKYIEHKYKNNVKIPVEVEYEQNYFIKITKAWIDERGRVTLTDLGESKRITDFDGIFYGVLNKIGQELKRLPKTFQLAQIQQQLYNLDSQRLDTLRKNGFPILAVQANAEEELNLSLSNDTVLKVPMDPDLKHMPNYIEADLEGVIQTTEIIQEKKTTVYKVFTNGLFSDNVVYSNVFTSLIAQRSFTSVVNNLYLVFQDEILNKMTEDIMFIYDLRTTFEYNYEPIDLENEEIQESVEDLLT